MGKFKEDMGKMKPMENVKNEPLMGQLQSLSLKDCGIEDEEVECTLCEEDDYPSLYVEVYTDQFKNEEIQYDLTSSFSKHPQVPSNHP